MLNWWFNGGFEGDMVWQGAKFPRFLLAHPRDHVTQDTVVRSQTPGSTQGATWNTMEFFAATASECVWHERVHGTGCACACARADGGCGPSRAVTGESLLPWAPG